MPRLLALGHVTRDRRPGGDVLGGSVSYAALAARRLGWDAAILTAAGPDFDPAGELPGVEVFLRRSAATTRFANEYDADGTRHQVVTARADDVDLEPLPDAWRDPDVLLLGPVAGELFSVGATALEAACVGAIAQGYVRAIDAGRPSSARAAGSAPRATCWACTCSSSPSTTCPRPTRARASSCPACRSSRSPAAGAGSRCSRATPCTTCPALPRAEVDPTGAGDVFAAAFLLRYHETADPLDAAAFGACAASCVVEGVGATTLGDRDEVLRRLALRERLLEDGECEEA